MKHQKQKKKSRWFSNLLLILLFLVGLILIFNEPIKKMLVQHLTTEQSISNLTAQQVKQNEKKKASYDFSDVKSLDLKTAAKAQINKDNLSQIGGIAIPSINLSLPIIKGTSNEALSAGAGTMKPDEQMGKGNYALASHNMLSKGLLFSSLPDTKIGDVIYLTDLSYIYTYKINRQFYVNPDRVDVIEDHKNKTEVTLVTCNTSGNQRFIVTGTYVKKTPMKKATQQMADAFNLKN